MRIDATIQYDVYKFCEGCSNIFTIDGKCMVCSCESNKPVCQKCKLKYYLINSVCVKCCQYSEKPYRVCIIDSPDMVLSCENCRYTVGSVSANVIKDFKDRRVRFQQFIHTKIMCEQINLLKKEVETLKIKLEDKRIEDLEAKFEELIGIVRAFGTQ